MISKATLTHPIVTSKTAFTSPNTKTLKSPISQDNFTLRFGSQAKPKPDLIETLRVAARDGKLGTIRGLLDAGKASLKDLDEQDGIGHTPLHWAAGRGNIAVVQFLIDRKADVNLKGKKDHKTALHIAAENGYTETAKRLIQAKADLNAQSNTGETALHYAIQNTNEALVDALLKANADITLGNMHNQAPLHLAAKSGTTGLVKAILAAISTKSKDAKEAIVNATDVNKDTPLHMASGLKNNPEIINLLIKAGANPNVANVHKLAPLHTAAYNNLPENVETLLKAYPNNINVLTENGDTALHYAVAAGSEKMTQLLLDTGAYRDVQNIKQATPLMLAASRGYTNIVKQLLEAKAEVSLKSADNKNALVYAYEQNHSPVVELLAHKMGISKGDIPDYVKAFQG